jgi:sporulation protein YlmC with PRC-barrel domain
MTMSKRILTLALAGFAAAAWGSIDTATAADTKAKSSTVDKPAETKTESSARADRRDIQAHPGGLVQTKWLLGQTLHDADGKDIGRIEEFWVDPKTGQVKDVIVSMGATLGVGGRDKVIGWKDLKIQWKDQKPFVSANPNALRDAYQTKMDREDRGPAASPATSEKKPATKR